jgi:hypothetical protein
MHPEMAPLTPNLAKELAALKQEQDTLEGRVGRQRPDAEDPETPRRIGQRSNVVVCFLTYNDTMQMSCLQLMGKKLLVSLPMEGNLD